MLSNFKRLVLTLQCCLLRSNGMEGTYAGVTKYLCETLPTEDKKVLGFISSLPVDGDWYMLYRELHVELNTYEREIISEYLKQIGCKPMEGRLCYITNETCSEYLYTHLQPTRRYLERYSDYCLPTRQYFVFLWLYFGLLVKTTIATSLVFTIVNILVLKIQKISPFGIALSIFIKVLTN